jgi:SynChlorMet cassette radical SAM/SPASM protein ScmF
MGCELELIAQKPAAAAQRKLDLPEGVPPLTSLYMYIAGSCNLACRHCWISPTFEPDNSKGQFLKLEYIKKAVKEAKPLGLQSVKLTGGEPMLHPQFRQIVEYLDSENISISMETNGTLIDDKMARYLKSKSHFNFFSISLDGARPETNDNLRGIKGSFEKAVAGIRASIRAEFHPQIICTLYRGNIGEIEDVILLADNLGCGSIKFNHVQFMGRGDDFYKKQGLSIPELIDIFNKIEKTFKPKYKLPIFFDIPKAFFPMKKLLAESFSRCSIKNVLGLLADGGLALCGVGKTIPELYFGNIEIDSVATIWTENLKLIELRNLIPNHFIGICGECLMREMCLGSCIANNFHISKKINASYFFCEESNELGLFPRQRMKIMENKHEKKISKTPV